MKLNKTTLDTISDLLKDNLNKLNTEDILISLYIKTDKDIEDIVKRFEKVVLIAKLHPDKLQAVLYQFVEDLILSFKEDISYLKNYYKFFYKMFNHLNNKHTLLSDCYISLALEVLSQLSNDGNILYGINNNDELIFKQEPFPGLFNVINSSDNLSEFANNVRKFGKRYGFNQTNVKNLLEIDRVLSNQIYSLAGVMSDEDFFLYPTTKDIRFSSESINVRKWLDDDFYLDLLKNRVYMLPKEGILCRFKNYGEIKEIYFKEKIFMDNLALIFQVTDINDKKSIGLFIPSENVYLDIFSCYSLKNMITYKSAILEVYCHLTTNMEITRKKMSAIHISKSLENITGSYYLSQPIMQIMVKENLDNDGYEIKRKYKKRKPKFINYNKSEFIEVKKFISPFIRKLPFGQQASEEAIERALSYGYKLKEGETFVKPFEKNIKQEKERS